jgi:hypothetical protein
VAGTHDDRGRLRRDSPRAGDELAQAAAAKTQRSTLPSSTRGPAGGSKQALIDLFATGDARADLARLLRRAEVVGLGHGQRELDRRELFAAKLGGAPAAANPTLDVAALSADELLGEILDHHEAQYWQRADSRWHLELHPDDRRMAVALAVLCGLSSDQEDERLVRLVPSLGDALAERVTKVVRWLRDLYGPHGRLEPDLLAEVLVGRMIIASPVLLDVALDAASEVQFSRALLVLSRVAERSVGARAVVRHAFDERLGQLVGRAVADGEDLVAALRLAIAATRPLLGAIGVQHDVPIRSAATGLLAVEIGELAIEGLRRMTETDEDTYRPLLAAALTTQSTTLSETGRPTEGLPSIEEAVTHYRALAEADPTRFLPNLATSLNNQSRILDDLGRSGTTAARCGIHPALSRL